MLGYKAAVAYNIHVVITLEIPEDALTNLERNNVAVKEFAKFRCNKAKVIKIEDENGKEYDEAESYNYPYDKKVYKLNENVCVHTFNNDLDNICSSGIHFFLNKRVAELYGVKYLENGLFESWHDNGNKECQVNYVNAKKEGVYKEWYESGNKYKEIIFNNDKMNGLNIKWHENGVKKYECMYVNGLKNGFEKDWDKYGNLTCINNYTLGKYTPFGNHTPCCIS